MVYEGTVLRPKNEAESWEGCGEKNNNARKNRILYEPCSVLTLASLGVQNQPGVSLQKDGGEAAKRGWELGQMWEKE